MMSGWSEWKALGYGATTSAVGSMKLDSHRSDKMSASAQEKEDLKNWENMMACCLPCGYVWYKEGTGSSCFINLLLGCVLGSCCVNICHACTYVNQAPKPGSPCDIVATHGRTVTGIEGAGVVLKQPGQ